MPVAYIDIPSGLATNAKARLAKDVAESLHDAYPIPDTRVFLREWTAEQTSIDGVLAAPFRPVCDFIVPPGLLAEGKRLLVSRVASSVARACELPADVVLLASGKQVSTRWVLSFFREVPLEQAALDDLMAFENPMVLESVEGKAIGRKAR
jgi:phenylpyruvate tautomerase PptA (4-oxalocrotonate tautomerase family)